MRGEKKALIVAGVIPGNRRSVAENGEKIRIRVQYYGRSIRTNMRAHLYEILISQYLSIVNQKLLPLCALKRLKLVWRMTSLQFTTMLIPTVKTTIIDLPQRILVCTPYHSPKGGN
jgi:hypothetical protein